jgi:thioredoxin 1
MAERRYKVKSGLFILAASLLICVSALQAQEATQIDTTIKKKIAPLVTFIELGSVTCIPCKQMKPVMKAIEEKYGTQVKIIFYDVWKPDQKQYAQQYGIRAIPTQVFLDEKGNEFFRHMGFYDEKSIDKLLQGKGLKPKPVTKVDG